MIEENGFPSREYSLKRVFDDPELGSQRPTPTALQVPRGTRYPRVYLIIKHLLLAILFLMVIWHLLKIPLADQYLREKIPKDLPESSVTVIKTTVMIARVLVIFLCFFGIFGVIKESFSLSLVFAVFMFIRLVAALYVPYFNNGGVSTALICLVTLLSFIFLSLVRRTDYEEEFDTSRSESDNCSHLNQHHDHHDNHLHHQQHRQHHQEHHYHLNGDHEAQLDHHYRSSCNNNDSLRDSSLISHTNNPNKSSNLQIMQQRIRQPTSESIVI